MAGRSSNALCVTSDSLLSSQPLLVTRLCRGFTCTYQLVIQPKTSWVPYAHFWSSFFAWFFHLCCSVLWILAASEALNSDHCLLSWVRVLCFPWPSPLCHGPESLSRQSGHRAHDRSFMNRSPALPPLQDLKTVVLWILSSFPVEFGGRLVLYKLLRHGQNCKSSKFSF